MESLIILIVMGIVSMLFKGKKPGEQPKAQTKQPTASNPRPADPMRKLKEMSQEMYKEIQREFQIEIEEPPSRQSPPATQPQTAVSQAEHRMPPKREKAAAVERKLPERSSSRESSHRGRLSAHGGKHVWEEAVEHHEMIPKSERDIIKGIIFSEILGPPK